MAKPSKRKFSYDYQRPALTVDVVLLTREPSPKLLLIQRGKDPFAGAWALPGGFAEEGETLAAAARRELLEETGTEVGDLEQLFTAGDPGRDPRGWTVSVAFLARVNPGEVTPKAADDAAACGGSRWASCRRWRSTTRRSWGGRRRGCGTGGRERRGETQA